MLTLQDGSEDSVQEHSLSTCLFYLKLSDTPAFKEFKV